MDRLKPLLTEIGNIPITDEELNSLKLIAATLPDSVKNLTSVVHKTKHRVIMQIVDLLKEPEAEVARDD